MERRELKKLLTEYVDLLTKYEQKGNKKSAATVEKMIEHIKGRLNS